jgi:acetolactate synthase-1/3 small subunit
MLITITAAPEKRPEIWTLVQMFDGKVASLDNKNIMVEVCGTEDKIEAFVAACQPYGVKNVVRSGTVAMTH